MKKTKHKKIVDIENRRTFIKKTTIGTAGVSLGLNAVPARSHGRIPGANERVNVAIIGLRGRGRDLMRAFSSMYDDGVFIKTVCDVDTQYFEAGIGEVFMARGTCFKPRDPFGIAPDSEAPPTLDYDMWLGPASWRPYNEKRVHYNWHWHWNTGNGDTGNQGPHQFDIARWGLGKKVHPVKVQSMGGIFGISPRECSQETPNTQTSIYEYGDGKILEFETRGRYTNSESFAGIMIGNLFYGTEGWLEINGSNWKAYRQHEEKPFAGSGMEAEGAAVGDDRTYLAAPSSGGHFANFIDAVRSGDPSALNCDILEGHMSSVLPHLGNIAYRVGESLEFNGEFEKFIDNQEADMLLSRNYRHPYIIPEVV